MKEQTPRATGKEQLKFKSLKASNKQNRVHKPKADICDLTSSFSRMLLGEPRSNPETHDSPGHERGVKDVVAGKGQEMHESRTAKAVIIDDADQSVLETLAGLMLNDDFQKASSKLPGWAIEALQSSVNTDDKSMDALSLLLTRTDTTIEPRSRKNSTKFGRRRVRFNFPRNKRRRRSTRLGPHVILTDARKEFDGTPRDWREFDIPLTMEFREQAAGCRIQFPILLLASEVPKLAVLRRLAEETQAKNLHFPGMFHVQPAKFVFVIERSGFRAVVRADQGTEMEFHAFLRKLAVMGKERREVEENNGRNLSSGAKTASCGKAGSASDISGLIEVLF